MPTRWATKGQGSKLTGQQQPRVDPAAVRSPAQKEALTAAGLSCSGFWIAHKQARWLTITIWRGEGMAERFELSQATETFQMTGE